MRKRKRRPKLNTTAVENGRFFPAIQKKLAVGQPGDAYELEANRMADTVTYSGENSPVQKKESKEEIQQKPLVESISTLQKKELPLGEELAQKMEAEEPIQAMEEEEAVQAMEEEEAVQAMEEEEETVQAMEEEETIQAMEEEEAVQAMEEEEETVQAMEEEEETVQAMEEEEETVQAMEEEEETVQAKSRSNKTLPRIETLLKETKGKGQKLSADILIEMNKNFGEDFSDVKIHTNDNAIKMCEELRAQAFTNGTDIYFNEGKYNPDSVSGKHLLAHELTHIIQQNK